MLMMIVYRFSFLETHSMILQQLLVGVKRQYQLSVIVAFDL